MEAIGTESRHVMRMSPTVRTVHQGIGAYPDTVEVRAKCTTLKLRTSETNDVPEIVRVVPSVQIEPLHPDTAVVVGDGGSALRVGWPDGYVALTPDTDTATVHVPLHPAETISVHVIVVEDDAAVTTHFGRKVWYVPPENVMLFLVLTLVVENPVPDTVTTVELGQAVRVHPLNAVTVGCALTKAISASAQATERKNAL